MNGYSKKELGILDKITKKWIGCTYLELLENNPEEADYIYCYAADNGII